MASLHHFNAKNKPSPLVFPGNTLISCIFGLVSQQGHVYKMCHRRSILCFVFVFLFVVY